MHLNFTNEGSSSSKRVMKDNKTTCTVRLATKVPVAAVWKAQLRDEAYILRCKLSTTAGVENGTRQNRGRNYSRPNHPSIPEPCAAP